MYAKYYKQASQVADQIRAGEYKRPERQHQSLVAPRPQQTKEEPEDNSMSMQEKMVASYIASLRKGTQNASQPDVKGPATEPATGTLAQAMAAISDVESKGSGGYSALGPVMEKGAYKGDRAYGKYQVMGRNIPSWTKEALGHAMSPEQFLANEAAQDAVAAKRLQKYYDKHGTWEDVASVWFSGQPLAKAKGRDDGYLTTDQYVAKFTKAFNAQPIVRRKT